MRNHSIIIFAAILLTVSTWADARLVTQPVSDWAGVIDSNTQTRLEGYLWELKHKTGAELAVVTVNTTGDTPIEDYTLSLAEASGLGSKDEDDGCLVLIAVNDRKYRIEVGYGLEGVLPDGYVGGIGRDYFAPHFKNAHYAEGIEQGVLAIAHKIASDHNVSLDGVPKPAKVPQTNSSDWSNYIFFMLVILFFVGSATSSYGRRFPHGSLRYWLLSGWMPSSSGGRGGGFGGGGFGSFGGGGGGFGGGGASGGW